MSSFPSLPSVKKAMHPDYEKADGLNERWIETTIEVHWKMGRGLIGSITKILDSCLSQELETA